jgi:hypothetical protein
VQHAERDFLHFSKQLGARSACAASGADTRAPSPAIILFHFKEEQEEQENKECKKCLCDGEKCMFRYTRAKRADAAQAERCPRTGGPGSSSTRHGLLPGLAQLPLLLAPLAEAPAPRRLEEEGPTPMMKHRTGRLPLAPSGVAREFLDHVADIANISKNESASIPVDVPMVLPSVSP